MRPNRIKEEWAMNIELIIKYKDIIRRKESIWIINIEESVR